jgi:hypothetical protein
MSLYDSVTVSRFKFRSIAQGLHLMIGRCWRFLVMVRKEAIAVARLKRIGWRRRSTPSASLSEPSKTKCDRATPPGRVRS